MTERMKTWIKGFAGGVAVTVIVGGIGYFICFGSVPMIGEQGLSLSDLGKASKIAKLVDTYYLDYKEGDEDSQYTMEEGMYSGLVASLQDPYSSYYSEDAYKLLQESTQGAFRAFLEEKPVKYIGQLLMYALQFKIQDLSLRIEGCTGEMKQLEDALDNCIDNSGIYRLLDFRRRYTECGNMVLAVKEILSRIDKGYYPMQMQNSYVLQGEVLLEFRFLEERYELIKSTVLKDFDTYTSIINNNINRNARLLSIISLVGVVLNFMFGSLLAANPLLGIIGGLSVAGLSVGAPAVYHVSRRGNAPLPSGRGPIQTPSLPKFHRKEKRERDQWEK